MITARVIRSGADYAARHLRFSDYMDDHDRWGAERVLTSTPERAGQAKGQPSKPAARRRATAPAVDIPSRRRARQK